VVPPLVATIAAAAAAAAAAAGSSVSVSFRSRLSDILMMRAPKHADRGCVLDRWTLLLEGLPSRSLTGHCRATPGASTTS
jgi:hypothetical protein